MSIVAKLTFIFVVCISLSLGQHLLLLSEAHFISMFVQICFLKLKDCKLNTEGMICSVCHPYGSGCCLPIYFLAGFSRIIMPASIHISCPEHGFLIIDLTAHGQFVFQFIENLARIPQPLSTCVGWGGIAPPLFDILPHPPFS